MIGAPPKSVRKAVSSAIPHARLMIKQGALALALRLNTVRTSSIPMVSSGRRNSILTRLIPVVSQQVRVRFMLTWSMVSRRGFEVSTVVLRRYFNRWLATARDLPERLGMTSAPRLSCGGAPSQQAHRVCDPTCWPLVRPVRPN